MFAKPKYLPDTSIATAYAERQTALPGQNLVWLKHRRDEAVAGFGAAGWPAGSVEAWKFTSLKPVLEFTVPEGERPHQGDIRAAVEKLDALPVGPRMVFVNGVFNTSLSNIPEQAGVDIRPLSQLLNNDAGLVETYLGRLSVTDATAGFPQVSLALAEEGMVIRLEEGVELAQPLMVAHIHTGGAGAARVYSRHVIVLKPGSKMTLAEYQIGKPSAAYLANATSEIYISGGAALTHIFMQEESEWALQVNTRYIRQEKQSRYHGLVMTTGAKLNRIETQITLAGTQADSTLHTVQLVRDALHSDSTTRMVHDTVDATSNQHCRMILDDSAKGVWQGKTVVARDAQKTDARQLNKNLLLSRAAVAHTKPELEIYADDVKCSHGATVGELDAKALFYLESRGISPDDAKRLLVGAFAAEAIDGAVIQDDFKAILHRKVSEWMEAREGRA